MNEFKWFDAYEGGSIRDILVFTKKYNICPNKFVYTFGDNFKLDLNKLDLDELKNAYPEADIVLYNSYSKQTTSCVPNDEEDDEEDEYFAGGEWQSNLLRIFGDRIIFYIEESSIIVWYDNQTPKIEIEKLLTYIPKKEEKPKGAEIKLVAYDHGFYTVSSKIEPTIIDIDKNYNDDIKPVLEDINKFLNERKCGLIILRGKMGTGKTSFIRHLITTNPKNYVLVTQEIARSLASPEFTSFMIEHKNSIFILEDCEQILADRGSNFSGAISNILNMSDGLLSDIFNVKFICTFNAGIDKIDKALLRKGRCFANYEFKDLSVEKTKVLLNEQNITLENYKPMTLAEIFNYGENDCAEKPVASRKIGY